MSKPTDEMRLFMKEEESGKVLKWIKESGAKALKWVWSKMVVKFGKWLWNSLFVTLLVCLGASVVKGVSWTLMWIFHGIWWLFDWLEDRAMDIERWQKSWIQKKLSLKIKTI